MRPERYSHREVFALLALVLTAAFARSTHAAVALFDRTYVRETGSPKSVSDTFEVCDASANTRLIVLNGHGGQARVSSGSIELDGRTVLGPSDFSQSVERLEKPLPDLAQGRHGLTVELGSKPGAAIRVLIESDRSCGTPSPAASRTPAPGLTPTKTATATSPAGATPTPPTSITATPAVSRTATAAPTFGPLSIRITEPVDQAVLDDYTIQVRGVITGPPSTGVTVNGMPAIVSGGTFAVNNLPLNPPLEPGQRTLVAQASDIGGGSALHTISLSTAAKDPILGLQGKPSNGVAPLEVEFEYGFGGPAAFQTLTIDFDGDGNVDFVTDDPSAPLQNTYTVPGFYDVELRITDASGISHRARTAVQVSSAEVLDGQLVTAWDHMKASLRAGDVEGALTRIQKRKRDAVRRIFGALTEAQRADIDRILPDIAPVRFDQHHAEYQMRRIDDGQELSHFVLFAKDEDGVWRIKFF